MKNMTQMNNLKDHLVIDPANLDDELVQQASLYFRAADAHAEAIAIRDTLKEELATVDAELDADIRSSGDAKLTETKIKNLVQLHPKHQEAFVAYNEAKLSADKLSALTESFKQRNHMLKTLADKITADLYQVNSVRDVPSRQAEAYNSMKADLAKKRASS